MLFDCRKHHVAPLAEGLTRAADVSLITTNVDIRIQRALNERGGGEVAETFEVEQALEHGTIRHDEADPQTRHEHLGERADVNDLSAGVEGFKRRLGVTFIAQVADEIIFKDRDVIAFCQHDEFTAADTAQTRAGGIVKIGDRVNEFGVMLLQEFL